MADRKTQYTVPFSADSQQVNNIVINWLNTSGFKLMEKDGHQYYIRKSALSGNRFFEYYVEDNNLIILAYIRSLKRPMPLDNGFVGSFATTPYLDNLRTLIATINSLQPAMDSNNHQTSNVSDGNSTILAEQVERRYRKMAAFAFGLSVFDFIIGFFGATLGILFIILTYYLAIKGLKSSNKALSIVALILTTIAIFVLIIKIAFVLTMTNVRY
jgi:hypothetical protein